MFKKRLLFISNWAQGEALSGGDRIWIESAKRLFDKIAIFAYCSEEAKDMCHRLGATNIEFINTLSRLKSSSLFYNLFYRTFQALKNNPSSDTFNAVFSTSDFWPDSLPAFMMKLRKKNMIWIAGFFLFAPTPWQKDRPYRGRYFFIGLFYWLTQFPIYFIVRKYADIVFVTSQPDVKRFLTKKRNAEKIVVVRGGVNIAESETYFKSGEVIPVNKRKYDACFIGRFHYQKGILELVDIWKLLCAKKPQAQLGMIGLGPLENELKDKINRLGLRNNIELLGFLDGQDKYRVYMNSKIVVHPAIYDSGGMAAAEAMAWKLPGVSFDLESLKTYYPQGMMKTKCFDLSNFSDNIIALLENDNLYSKMSIAAYELIKNFWSWDNIANKVYAVLEQ